MSSRPDEETNEPLIADKRNFYKIEKWTKDGSKVDRLLYAGNDLDKARELFREAIQHPGSGSRSGSRRACSISGRQSI
jgi:hypothetical protein